MQYGGQKVPQSALCKLEKPGKLVIYFSLSRKAPRSRSSDVLGPEKIDLPAQGKRENLPFFNLFCCIQLSMNYVMPAHVGEGGSLYSVY